MIEYILWLQRVISCSYEEYFTGNSKCSNLKNIEDPSWYLPGSGAIGNLGISGGAYGFGEMLGEKETPSSASGLDLSIDFMTGEVWTIGPVMLFTPKVFPENR